MEGAAVSAGRRTAATARGSRELLLHDDGAVSIDGRRYDLRLVENGTWLVSNGDRAVLAHVAHDGEACWVHLEGQVHRIEIESAGTRIKRRSTTDASGLSAPMPATVLAVQVEPGQVVSPGETVIVLEAMKMELPVRAATGGTVTAVHCKAGELVQPGVPLLEIA
jgi:3-methylcrotonyl-CoA carboxylase alpha subunit